MSQDIITEIEKKRKKFLLDIFKFSCFSIAFVIFVTFFTTYLKFASQMFEYGKPYFYISGITTFVLLVISILVYNKVFSQQVSTLVMYAISEKLTGFKLIPLSNQENREYDSYLPSEIDWAKLPVPPEKILFSTILPRFDIYNIELRTMFNGLNNLQQEINVCDLIVIKDFHSGYPKREFSGLLLTIKTDKNLNSITYFQTYFAHTKQEFDVKLPKIDLGGNIDVYSNNADIAKQLLTPELSKILNKLKKQFKVEYAKVVFYNEYIVFILRTYDEMIEHNYFPVSVSLLTPLNVLKAAAVKNIQTLYDLANQAPEFKKNI